MADVNHSQLVSLINGRTTKYDQSEGARNGLARTVGEILLGKHDGLGDDLQILFWSWIILVVICHPTWLPQAVVM